MEQRQNAVVDAGVDGLSELVWPLRVAAAHERSHEHRIEIRAILSKARLKEEDALLGTHERDRAPRASRSLEYQRNAGVS